VIESQRKKLLLEKEERDRKMADKFREQENKRKEELRKKKEAAEKADAEMARKIQEELEEERKQETEKRRRFMMEASGYDQCEDENAYWKTHDAKSNRTYYVNCKTMKTTWELPENGRVVERRGGHGRVISSSSSNSSISSSSQNRSNSTSESPRKALATLERRLMRFYAVYKPDKTSEVRDIAQRYVRTQVKLFAALKKKYGVEPPTKLQMYLTMHSKKKGMIRSKTIIQCCWFEGTRGVLRCWSDRSEHNSGAEPMMVIPLDSVVRVEMKKDIKVENGTMEKALGLTYCQSGKGKKGKEVEIVLSTNEESIRNSWMLFFKAEATDAATASS